MDMERLSWMRDELKRLVVATEEMIQDKSGHISDPEMDEVVCGNGDAISYEELQAAALTLNNKGGRTALEQLMKRLGVVSLRKVAEADYGRALAVINDMIEETEVEEARKV